MTNQDYINDNFLRDGALIKNSYNASKHGMFFKLLAEKYGRTKNKVELIWLELNVSGPGKCEICGQSTEFLNFSKGYRHFCSTDCMHMSEDVKTKRVKSGRDTCLTRYGVANAAQSEIVKTKTKEAIHEKYGVTHFFQSDQFRQQYKETCQSRYGIEHSTTPETVLKIKDTIISRYGRPSGRDFSSNRSKRHDEIMRWCDTMNISFAEDFTELQNEYEFSHTCGSRWQQNLFKLPRCPSCHRGSLVEKSLKEWILTLNVKVIFNDRKIITPLELDVFFPELNVAIEMNGVYWHSDQLSSISVQEKTEICRAKNVQLISIWEYEWNDEFTQEKLKRIIRAKLGLAPRIYARSTIADIIPIQEAKEFQNMFHINGWCRAGNYFGLRAPDGKLLMCISIGQKRFSKVKQLELIRMCSDGSVIVGGISKLLKFARAHVQGPIFTYCDLRFGDGRGYLAVGFKHIGNTKPNYKWFKGKTVLPREACQHKNLYNILDMYDEDLTEAQNLEREGWLRISDAGNARFIID